METTIDTVAGQAKQQGTQAHRIVVVGGGAGGLELVTQLGDQLGKAGKAHVTLVDREATHLWKPLLHEVAAGSMDPNTHQLEYIAQARWHHFEFQQGEMLDLDRVNKTLTVAAVVDQDNDQILPERRIPYDTLVLAIGSVTNFFGIPGAAEHAMAIDTVGQADDGKATVAGVLREGEGFFGIRGEGDGEHRIAGTEREAVVELADAVMQHGGDGHLFEDVDEVGGHGEGAAEADDMDGFGL